MFSRRFLALLLVFSYTFSFTIGPRQAHAQMVLPTPGTMVSLSAAFNAIMLKGIKINPDNPMQFDFLIDAGDEKGDRLLFSEDEKSSLSPFSFKNTADRLIKYFLACLAIPEDELWVNLSPYEKERMIPEALGQTE